MSAALKKYAGRRLTGFTPSERAEFEDAAKAMHKAGAHGQKQPLGCPICRMLRKTMRKHQSKAKA